MKPEARRLPLAASLLVSALCLLASRGPLRLTWTNEGVSAAFPWHTLALAAVAALGVVPALVLVSRPAGRLILGLAALGLAARAGDRAAYHLEAAATGLSQRTLLGSSALDWSQVSQVAGSARAILVRDKAGAVIEIPVSLVRPEDRATLERTLSRRIRESQTPKP